MVFPKISGNSNLLFDLIDINEPYNGLTINNSNQAGVFTAVFTDAADDHTEAYLFFVVKNITPLADAATNLTLSQIKIASVDELGSEIRTEWSTDGATITHEQTGPIECDYVLTGTTDLFVGIEDGAGNIGTGDIATHVHTNPSSSLNSITSSNKFVKFKVENGTNGVGEVMIDEAGSETHVHQMPLYTATQLCSAENGGIPNHSYAAFPIRISIDDVAAFDTLFYRLIISHDGTVGTGADADSSDIVIPITISAQNLMKAQVFVGSTLKATGNETGDGGTLISRMNAMPSNLSVGTTSAVDYGFAEGAAAPSSTSQFANLDDATAYKDDDVNVYEALHDTRTAFNGDEEAVTWRDTSAIGSEKSLTISHVENNDTTVMSNLVYPFDISTMTMSADVSQHSIYFNQTAAGSGISTIEEKKLTDFGGYLNFTQGEATKTATITFQARTGAEVIDTVLNIGYVKYPVMSMGVKTKEVLVNNDYTKGKIYGANSTFSGNASVDTNPIHHDHATSGNSTIYLARATSATNSHFIPGHSLNYEASTGYMEMVNINPSTIPLEVRLNSLKAADNPLFNGITSFSDATIMQGAGFADFGCEVEQALVGAASDLPAYGSGSADNADGANNQITAVISDSGYRDYAVRIKTSAGSYRIFSPALFEGDFYDYSNQIPGFGAERYQVGISMPTGLIDYGYGLTPNHAHFSEKLKIAFAQFPCLPMLQTFVYDGAPIDTTHIEGETESVTIDTKWTKLTVLPNALTGAVSSSRGGASDGLYDWAKDTSADNTNKGTFKMVSTYNAETTDGSYFVDLVIHEVLSVNGAVSANATTITVSTAGVLQEGMRLLEQKGGADASQRAANTALFAATPYIVSDITGTTVTIVKDLGYAADGTSNIVTTNVLPAIENGADLVFIDDWVQTGMLVEHDNLVETEKEYSVSQVFYQGGSENGNAHSLAAFPAALTGGATHVRLRLAHKRLTSGAVTNGTATGASTDKKLTFLKPHENFTEVDAGINLKYEIKNQSLNRAKIGEKVRVVGGTTSFPAVTEISGSASVGQETIVTADTSGVLSSAKCDIIVEKRGSKNVYEPGVTKFDGTRLLSKKNIGNATTGVNSIYYAGIDASQGLALYQFPATLVGGGVYYKEFTVALVNAGEEDIYWASAEFIDPTWVRYKDSNGLVFAKQPSGATGVNWQVCNLGGSFTSKVTGSIYNVASNLDIAPSVLTNSIDARVARQFSGSNLENVIGCRFEVSVGAGISGSYYKYLKIEYVRDTGITKHYYNGSSIVERPFKDKEVWIAYIPILVTLDAAGQIEMQDVDGTSIETGTTISIDGLIS